MDSALRRLKNYESRIMDQETNGESLLKAKSYKLKAKLRPWLQDFNLGADYDADMVRAEIQAVQDSLGSDFAGYMLWNPSNFYTREALMSDE